MSLRITKSSSDESNIIIAVAVKQDGKLCMVTTMFILFLFDLTLAMDIRLFGKVFTSYKEFLDTLDGCKWSKKQKQKYKESMFGETSLYGLHTTRRRRKTT